MPSLYGALIDDLAVRAVRDDFAGTLIVAGEACPPSFVDRHHESSPQSR